MHEARHRFCVALGQDANENSRGSMGQLSLLRFEVYFATYLS